MDIRATDQQYNPYRIFTREQWARLRDDTPMTLEPGEFERLRSLHDRLDMQEVEAALAQRTGMSGLEEKAARKRDS